MLIQVKALCKDILVRSPPQCAPGSTVDHFRLPKAKLVGNISSCSWPHGACFHTFSYHTLLPSHWIPATARQVPTCLLQPQPTPGCLLSRTNPQGCDTPTPRRPQTRGHWTQGNKPQPAQANTSPDSSRGSALPGQKKALAKAKTSYFLNYAKTFSKDSLLY